MISPNKTSPRNHAIDTISIHCMAAPLSVESCGALFASPSRNASSNYGIGPDGKIAMYVEEKDRSWCTSNKANDMRAVTIEVASSSTSPYEVTQAAYNSLINLLVDICKRNNINKLLWKGDKTLIGKIDQQNMTVHRWFAKKQCPGDYLYNKHSEIANAVNEILNPTIKPSLDSFIVEILVDILNIRSGPGTSYAQVGTVTKGQKYTIVEIVDNWGKLKSGAGWISLNTKYVKKSEPSVSTPEPASPIVTYKVGQVYTLQEEMSVRTGPGTNYSKKTYSQLSADAKKSDKDKDGALDKGTKVTCKEIQKNGNTTWMRCPSGWIAACNESKIYIK